MIDLLAIAFLVFLGITAAAALLFGACVIWVAMFCLVRDWWSR